MSSKSLKSAHTPSGRAVVARPLCRPASISVSGMSDSNRSLHSPRFISPPPSASSLPSDAKRCLLGSAVSDRASRKRSRSPSGSGSQESSKYGQRPPSRNVRQRLQNPTPSGGVSSHQERSPLSPLSPAPETICGTCAPALPVWQRSSSPAPKKLGQTTFNYRELDSSKNEVRLLRILPNASPNIMCDIIHTSLDNPHEYMAISYAWGDPEDTETIQLEGHEYPVTSSLWHALARLRSIKNVVVVWADAICINQHNLEERNHQVELMTVIYRKAFTVALWLGPQFDDSHAAIDLLSEIVEASRLEEPQLEVNAIINNKERKNHWRALVNLFEREYWSRLWTVQEIFNAKKVTVFCGASALPWRTYLEASNLLMRHFQDLMQAFPLSIRDQSSDNCSGKLFSYVECLVNGGPGTLRGLLSFYETRNANVLNCLLLCANKSCSDPRDKLYGILGILPERERALFQVDYNTSIRDVYTDIVDYVLTTTGNLDVICCASNSHFLENPNMLPSWVPNWSQEARWRHPMVKIPLTRFAASGNTMAQYSFSNQRRKLAISAIILGTIANRAISTEPVPSTSSYLMTFLQWYLIFIRRKSISTDKDHEAFCRTLSLDRFQHRCSAQEWVRWTYHIFTTLIRDRYPSLVLDPALLHYAQQAPEMPRGVTSQIFEDYFEVPIAKRKFLVASSGLLCLGSDHANSSDIICVPLGCSTPIILRKKGNEYIFIGDCYVDGYMYGRAIQEWEAGDRELYNFVLA